MSNYNVESINISSDNQYNGSSINPPVNSIINPPCICDYIWSLYCNYALAIRRTDGQQTTSLDAILDYIKSDAFNYNIPNPLNGFTGNVAPSYSTSLLYQFTCI